MTDPDVGPAMVFSLPTGMSQHVDEHGGVKLVLDDTPATARFEARVESFTVDEVGSDLSQIAATATATHRMTLSDAVVLHVQSDTGGLFGGDQRTVVIAYRSGEFSFTLHSCYSIRPDLGTVFTLSSACLSADYPVFLPLVLHIIENGSVQPGPATRSSR